MTAIPVERYMFTVDEVVAAILPNVGRARELELRVDADGYVVIDVVAPVAPAEPLAQKQEIPADDDTFPANRPSQAAQPASAEPGPKESEARILCSTPLFRAFLEVKTEEAAAKILVERCHVQRLADLDRTRSNGMNLRHVVEEFEAWKIT
ncbi:hypothetical protein [Rhizobium leguminosarum]|uniref:hypothetical protein n=1 Tax=Rhizobium leguminosarum TaxID=384 RepID=UPI0014424344|nr:hypothetical protein [Rhizobium leguminosarum]MDH6273641.1 hypothetical protein [Rhizobium leguminosarum]NKK01009.1 hypothetical protein [Rhizobium leguminosarum bv. viciae]NKK87284.1 hypothetical protein [Rhizobium leguminosarum bv. viciae]